MRARKAEEGFTLLELTVAMGLAAFVFAAVAAVMLGGLRSLAVAKARTQGNEVATQAIEDLQRFGYPELGLCAAPAVPAPSGLTDTVLLSGGCAGATVEDSCNTPEGSAISSQYNCTRNNITYDVKRYIAWSNPEQTSKRLAVFVTWTDQVGLHTVSQQSSVRAPGVANIVGIKPPSLTSPSVTAPSQIQLVGGQLAAGDQIQLSVDSTELTAADQVAAVFSVLDMYGQPQAESIFLTTAGTGTWTGAITASNGFTFGPGTQYVSFNAIRAKDGKQTAAIATQILQFCEATCSSTNSPTLGGASLPGGKVGIHPSGALKASFTVSVNTTNVTTDDTVTVAFMTQHGLVTLPLQISATGPCTITSCTWTTTVTPTNGYAFAAGSQNFYFLAKQIKSADPLSVDQGQTVAMKTLTQVEFGS